MPIWAPPGGDGLGSRFSFRWNNKVAWSTVCEPLNAGLPPKKHLRDLTHRARRSCPNRALTEQEHRNTPTHRTWYIVRCRCYESRRESKVTRRGYANSGRTRQWHHHRACGGRVNVRRLLPLPLLLLMRYGIHPPVPAQHMRRRHRTCVHRRARWRAAPAGNAKTHSTPSSHHDDGVEHK